MPTILNPQLTLAIKPSNQVEIEVTYTAAFTALERSLAAAGMQYQEIIETMGMDPPGSLTGTVISACAFAPEFITVPAGAGLAAIFRTRTITTSRSILNEDRGYGDPDEIRCRISVNAVGANNAQEFTPEVILSS